MFCDLPLSFSVLSVHCKACHRLRGSLLAVHAQAAGGNASSVSYLVAREQWGTNAWAKLEFWVFAMSCLCVLGQAICEGWDSSLPMLDSLYLNFSLVEDSACGRGRVREGDWFTILDYFICLKREQTSQWRHLILASYTVSSAGYFRLAPKTFLLKLRLTINIWNLWDCECV